MSRPTIDYSARQLKTLQRLIRFNPVYGSAGQKSAVKLLLDELHSLGWDRAMEQTYTAKQFRTDPLYIPVNTFSDAFAGDEKYPKSNVIGILDSGQPGPVLILNGHYDVEPNGIATEWHDPSGWKSGAERHGKIWGRGASDMLAGLTSLLYTASRFTQTEAWRGKIIFTAVTDEEIGGNGTLAVLHYLQRQALLAADDEVYCLVAEPSNGIIANESLGFSHLSLEIRGHGRHIAGAVKTDNAINALTDIVSSFDNTLAEAATRLGIKREQLVHNFGVVHGGLDAATPIPELTCEATIFYPATVTKEALAATLTELIHKAHTNVFAHFLGFCFPGQVSPTNALFRALVGVASHQSFRAGLFPSPCDARLFDAFGIQNVVIFGPGSLAQAHAPNEYVAIDEILSYNQVIYTALGKLLGA